MTLDRTAEAYGIEYRGHVIRIGTDALVGRSPACKVLIDHPDVSRRHARLAVSPEGVVLEDLGSANGVYVNGERVEGRRRLTIGDRIEIGGESMRFVGGEPTPPRPAPRPSPARDEVSEAAFDELWDDEHESRFDQGETTALSSLATKLSLVAAQQLEEGELVRAEQNLTAAIDYLVKRAETGVRVSKAEIEAVSRVLLEIERQARRSPSCDWMARLAEVLAATNHTPPRGLLDRLTEALHGASPAAVGAWRRYLGQVKKRELSPADRGWLLVVEQALHS